MKCEDFQIPDCLACAATKCSQSKSRYECRMNDSKSYLDFCIAKEGFNIKFGIVSYIRYIKDMFPITIDREMMVLAALISIYYPAIDINKLLLLI